MRAIKQLLLELYRRLIEPARYVPITPHFRLCPARVRNGRRLR